MTKESALCRVQLMSYPTQAFAKLVKS